jgi:hypothetical protein
MQSNPQRLAWITMLSGLAIFCLLCVSTVLFARWLLFESPTGLNVTLHVGRGTVGLASETTSGEQAIRSSAQVNPSARLSTDSDSQGYLSFSDPYSNREIVTVLLRNASVAHLNTASRPRFSLSDNPYEIRLTGINGRVEVRVNNDLDRDIRLSLEGAMGEVRIDTSGTYWIESTLTSFKVTVREGSATLINADHRAQHITASNIGSINAGDPIIYLSAGPTEILPNSTFIESRDGNWPVGWSCTTSADVAGKIEGHWSFINDDGRPIIHISREGDPEPNHGETRCLQYLTDDDPEYGHNVLQYSDLRLRATMMINYQQLSACGDQGTECAVMLRIEYLDTNGNRMADWIHGFYAEYTPNLGRTTCDTCWGEHERINKNAWYTFESGNLLMDLPENIRPGWIISIQFYASGHQYDVMLSEVSLLGTQKPEIAVDTP